MAHSSPAWADFAHRLASSGVGYWFYLKPKVENLDTLVQKEQELKTTVMIKANKVATLPKLKAQLDELSERYDYLSRQLLFKKSWQVCWRR